MVSTPQSPGWGPIPLHAFLTISDIPFFYFHVLLCLSHHGYSSLAKLVSLPPARILENRKAHRRLWTSSLPLPGFQGWHVSQYPKQRPSGEVVAGLCLISLYGLLFRLKKVGRQDVESGKGGLLK